MINVYLLLDSYEWHLSVFACLVFGKAIVTLL